MWAVVDALAAEGKDGATAGRSADSWGAVQEGKGAVAKGEDPKAEVVGE